MTHLIKVQNLVDGLKFDIIFAVLFSVLTPINLMLWSFEIRKVSSEDSWALMGK